MKTIHEINKPEVTTYFIAYTDEIEFAYGEVTPAQQMSTGQPNLFKTVNKQEWIEKLINDFDTDPFAEIDTGLDTGLDTELDEYFTENDEDYGFETTT